MSLSREGSLSSTTSNSHSHPEKIGPWKLGKTLGRGATGRVLLGVNTVTGQKAAVKVVSKSALNDEYDKPTKGGLPYGIEREIIIMKLLTHPNVLRLYDVWETSKALYLVLEYVEGGELFDLLVERGPLQEQEAVKYFRQIVLGTAYCHALGICHRDLKPENLLLDASLNVKLADFGMAALESDGKLLETSCGSPHYAAPEIVSGLKYHGAASDVWSCGVILFALLTGRLPFDDENIRNLLLKVQAGSFEMPDELSPDAQDLIRSLLTADPMKRMSTPEILNHRLLNKYPIPNEDLISVKSLPHPETAYRSLGSIKNIDKQILQNLSILWHDRSEDDIIKCLLKEGPNPEKTFYALLLRYRHNSDDTATPSSSTNVSPEKRIPRSGSSMSNRASKRRSAKISASSAKNRPVSFQRRYGANRNSVINTGRLSVASSVQNSPFKSPGRNNRGYSQSPSKSPHRKPSYSRQSNASLPRNLYNEIVNAQEESQGSLAPTLPSKDSIYAPNGNVMNQPQLGVPSNEEREEELKKTQQILQSSANIVSDPNANKRNSIASKRMSRRRSVRQSLTTGLKRNSITVKLLSTYAKLSSESDWEYMDKQTKRTSATFASLCDKIFNQEQYNADDELLEDEEEKRAKEYERLMEVERKKHEAELKARKELAKQKKRQKRRSIFGSSKKLSITVTEDDASTDELVPEGGPISQPKRQSKQIGNLRSISEGVKDEPNGELTHADVEVLKRRSVTQPNPRRRLTPILTRRPVSRLDPLWTAKDVKDPEENEETNKANEKTKKRVNRESMVSVGYADDTRRRSKQFGYENEEFQLPGHSDDDADLSEEYMKEIRKSKLLNSQYNLKNYLEDSQPASAPKSRDRRRESRTENRKTLIGSVHIPEVTRKSTHFSASNKRLSILTVRSTKESYRDLNSILDAHREDIDENELAEEEKLDHQMSSQLRYSFADRLNSMGLAEGGDDDEECMSEGGSVMDLDEHLANKRSSYYAGTAPKRYPTTKRHSVKAKKGPLDEGDTIMEQNDNLEKNADYTFADDANQPNEIDDEDVFEQIKLPKDNKRNSGKRASAPKNRASTMLIPDADKAAVEIKKERKTENAKPDSNALEEHTKRTKPLVDKTNTQTLPQQEQKRNRSIFRKLSWGTKKSMDESGAQQLPSPADSQTNSVEEKKVGFFSRLFSSSGSAPTADDIKRFRTILPRHEMITALYALLNSWSNFGLKQLRKDSVGYNITGAISSNNSFNLKSCKFRIKVNSRAVNQKSELICVKVKGSSATSTALFKEIQKVLEKEGVLEN